MKVQIIKRLTSIIALLVLCMAQVSNTSYNKKPAAKKVTTVKRVVHPAGTVKPAVRKKTPIKTVRKTPLKKTTVKPVTTTESSMIDMLRRQLRNNQQELANTLDEIEKLRITSNVAEGLSTLPEEIVRLTQEKTELSQKLQNQEIELQASLEEMITNREKLATAQQLIASKNQEVADCLSDKSRSDLEEQIMQQAIELANTAEQLASLNTQIIDLTKTITTLKEENMERVIDLTKTITTLKEENMERATRLANENTELETKNNNFKMVKRTLEKRLDTATNELKEEKENHALSEEAIKRTVTAQLKGEFDNRIAKLEQENAVLLATNKDLSNRPSIGPKQEDFDQLKRNLETEKTKIARLEAEIKEKAKKIETAQNETRTTSLTCEENIAKLKRELEKEQQKAIKQ